VTRNNFDDILDKCLYMLQNEQVPLDDCLTQFPQYAADLRPLLEMAVEVSRSPHPIATTSAFNSGKQRMLATLAEKKRTQAVSPSHLNRYAQQEQHPFSRLKEIFTMAKLNSFPMVAATALIIITGLAIGGNFAFQTWRAGEVTQTASLADMVGVVEVQLSGSASWQPVVSGVIVKPGDRIRTGSHSSVTLVFFDNSRTSLAADTRISVTQLSARRDGGNKVIALTQWMGQTVNRVERLLDPASRFEIETPTAVTAVRGTEFTIQVDDNGATRVAVTEGVVEVTAQESTVKVEAGQSTTVQPGEPPSSVAPAVDSSDTPQSPDESDDSGATGQDDDDTANTDDASSDNLGDSVDNDRDNDSAPDTDDAFPDDPDEDTDSDNDGVGDNADDDDDNDGAPDTDDAFPNDPDEDTDSDNDGVGDNADDDDDNDGTPDTDDAFPNDPDEDTDSDNDGR